MEASQRTLIGIGGYDPTELVKIIDAATGRTHRLNSNARRILVSAARHSLPYAIQKGDKIIVGARPAYGITQPVFDVEQIRNLMTLEQMIKIGD